MSPLKSCRRESARAWTGLSRALVSAKGQGRPRGLHPGLGTDGAVTDRSTSDHTAAGSKFLVRRLLAAGVCQVGIERGDGPVAESLLQAELVVLAISPNQVKNPGAATGRPVTKTTGSMSSLRMRSRAVYWTKRRSASSESCFDRLSARGIAAGDRFYPHGSLSEEVREEVGSGKAGRLLNLGWTTTAADLPETRSVAEFRPRFPA